MSPSAPQVKSGRDPRRRVAVSLTLIIHETELLLKILS